LTEKLLVNLDPGLYFFINQGCLTVDNMDDKEEMQIVEVRRSLFILLTLTLAGIPFPLPFHPLSLPSLPSP